VLSRNLNDIKQITTYMNECKHMGIRVLGPDVNESMRNFSANKAGDVRFGLAAIKGVGDAASISMIEERNNNGRFKDIYDFMERINYSVINRKCLENMAYAGGFDSLISFNRSKFFAVDSNGVAFLDALIRYGQLVQLEKSNAQQSLFGMGASAVDIQQPKVPVCEDWNQLTILNKEREVIGLYMSSHPLDQFSVILRKMCQVELSQLSDLTPLNGREIAVAGVIMSVTPLTTKDGRRYARFVLEDYNSTHEFTLFSKDFEKFGNLIEQNNFLFIRGRVQPRPYKEPAELEYKITSMMHLAEVGEQIKELHIDLKVGDVTHSFIEGLTDAVRASNGNTTLRLSIFDPESDVRLRFYSKRYRVGTTVDFISYLDDNEINYTIN
ncbi:MAG: DNA polymerase III subunit alpha, partial [Alistipes sp.]|nr:DNA polymerase III subunit alpha [Alistipes sp.]